MITRGFELQGGRTRRAQKKDLCSVCEWQKGLSCPYPAWGIAFVGTTPAKVKISEQTIILTGTGSHRRPPKSFPYYYRDRRRKDQTRKGLQWVNSPGNSHSTRTQLLPREKVPLLVCPRKREEVRRGPRKERGPVEDVG